MGADPRYSGCGTAAQGSPARGEIRF